MYRPAGDSDEDYSDFDEPEISTTRSYYNPTVTDTKANRLEEAIKSHSLEKVKEIIQEIDDLSKITLSNSLNAVTYAANVGNSSILQFIMDHYPLEEIKDTYTPLMGACNVPLSKSEDVEERKKCIKLLLDAEIDIDFKDRYGTNALMLACKLGRVDIVKFLLENNADVNLSDNDGWTPLFYAVNGRYLDTVKVLLDHQANVNKVDKRQRKAYDIAFQKNYSDIVPLLEPAEEDESQIEEQSKSINEIENNNRYEILESESPKFHKDVVEIVTASSKDMERYVPQFHREDISLRDFLTLKSEEKLKDIGVTFSVHRCTLLNRIRQFHLSSWSPNSFGLNNKDDSQYCSLVNIANFMATLYRQIYTLRSTFLYVKDDIRSSSEKDQLVESLQGIRSKLISINVQLDEIKKTANDVSIQTQPYLYAQKIKD